MESQGKDREFLWSGRLDTLLIPEKVDGRSFVVK